MKIYSIVHSNFRKKESLYYLFRPYFCHEQTGFRDMLGYIVIPSTKCLSYFIIEVLGIEIKVTLKVEGDTTITCQSLALVPAVDSPTHPA